MAEVKDDEKTFTITLEEVIGFTVTGYAITPEGDVPENVEISVDVTVKNNDSLMREVRIKLIDVEGSDQSPCPDSEPGNVIDKNPKYTYKDVNGGESATITVGTGRLPTPWCGAMPNKDWKLRVEAWRQV